MNSTLKEEDVEESRGQGAHAQVKLLDKRFAITVLSLHGPDTNALYSSKLAKVSKAI